MWREMMKGKESFSTDNDLGNNYGESNLEEEEELGEILRWIRIWTRQGRLRRGRIRGRSSRG